MEMIEIKCVECGGTGVVEYIDVWPRECDVCHGDGTIKVPPEYAA